LVKRYHPDWAPPDKREEYADRIREINDAWAVLGSEGDRRAYDAAAPGSGTLKRWPGGGPGVLRALVERRGSWWITKEILCFSRTKREQCFTVPISEVMFGRGYIFVNGDETDGAHIEVEVQDFPVMPDMNAVRNEIGGDVFIKLHQRKRARWNTHNGVGPIYSWETVSVDLVWSEKAARGIEHFCGVREPAHYQM
jgi:hypothetical protein